MKDAAAWLGAKALGLVIMVLAVGLVNLLLWGAQSVWHSGGKAKLDRLTRELEQERTAVEAMETRLTSLGSAVNTNERQLAQMDAGIGKSMSELARLRAKVTRWERQYAAGIPSRLYPLYQRQHAQHNALVPVHNARVATRKSRHGQYTRAVDDYNRLLDEYNRRTGAFNARVDEVNDLARSVGTTWYVIPIPSRRTRTATH